MKFKSEMDSTLKSIFEAYHVEADYLPDLLKPILEDPENDRHWTICKEKISKSITTPIAKTVPKKVEKSPDLDLTGSPLRCSFELNNDLDDSSFLETHPSEQESESFLPMSSIEARSLLSEYNVRNCTYPLPTIWCLVNDESTLLLGAHRTGKTRTVHEVTYLDARPLKALTNMEQIVSRHKALAPSGIKLDMWAEAEYNVIGDQVSEDFSEMKLRFRWPKPKTVLEPPSVDSTARLNVVIKPGDDKLTTFDTWTQLKLLNGFVAGANNQGVAWRKRTEDDPTLKEDLLDLLEKVKNIGPRSIHARSEVKGEENDGGEDKIGVVMDNVRQDVDFTDCLWSVLYKVESFNELCQSLTLILKTLQREEIRPFIYTRNETLIARIVQKIVRGTEESIPEMTGRLPLDILIEIGIEKLRRDYVHTLMTSELTTQDDLSPFIVKQKSNNWNQDMKNLLKLHYVLELVVLVQSFLSPTTSSLQTIVSQTLKDILHKKDDISWDQLNLSLQLQSSHFRDQLNKLNPSVWQCRLKSCLSLETVCHFSLNPSIPFRKISNGNGVNEYDDEDEEENLKLSFFTFLMVSISRDF